MSHKHSLKSKHDTSYINVSQLHSMLTADTKQRGTQLAAMLRWFTAGGAIIAERQLSQTRKLHHYDYKRQTKTETTSLHEII